MIYDILFFGCLIIKLENCTLRATLKKILRFEIQSHTEKMDLKHPMKSEFNSSPGLFMIYYYLGTHKNQISRTSLKLYVFKTNTHAFPHSFFLKTNTKLISDRADLSAKSLQKY